MRGLVGNFSGANPILVPQATTQTSANNILELTDTGTGFSFTTLATAATNEECSAASPSARNSRYNHHHCAVVNLQPGQSQHTFTLTAKVSPTSGPTGTVTFLDNGVVLPSGVVTLQPGSTTALCSVNGLPPGTN